MHVLVTGGTGFIGSALVPALAAQGHRLTVLTRQNLAPREGVSFVRSLSDVPTPVDAVINLAGASLADKRWSDSYKAEMIESRVGTTRDLVDWMEGLEVRPNILLSGSAIGFYGASETETFSEASSGGAGFAAELCQQWEDAALAAEALGVRVIIMRLGVVFDRDGGALTEMLRSFKLGVGSWVGTGRQWLSWIHRWDVVRSIAFLLEEEGASGVFNLVAPEAVTHRDFCNIASEQQKVLLKMGVPGSVLKAMVGEMAEELLLSGQRVVPESLQGLGFHFDYPDLSQALADIHTQPAPKRSLS